MPSAYRLNGRCAATQIEQQDGKSDTFLRSSAAHHQTHRIWLPYGILQSASHTLNITAVATICAAAMSDSDICFLIMQFGP